MITFFKKLYAALGEGRFGLGFSPSVGFSYFAGEISSGGVRSAQRKNEAVYRYLKKTYAALVEKYRSMSFHPENTEGERVIWVLWWDGESNMPPIIKACQRSKESAADGFKVILLDKNNVKNYADLPEFIWKMYNDGKLRLPHLADIIRVNLLKRHGGLWLDASIFCKGKLPKEIFDLEFFSLKGEKEGFEEHISLNQWSTFAIGGKKGNVVCEFLNDLFIEYCKMGKPFLYYYMFDCAIALGYREVPEIRRMIDAVPKTEGDAYWLEEHFDSECTEELLTQMNSEPSPMYKLSWRTPHEKENNLYHYIIKDLQ